MPFDISTAKIVEEPEESNNFDITTAKVVEDLSSDKNVFDINTAKVVEDTEGNSLDVGLAGNLKPNKDNALESFGYGFEKGGSDVTFIKQMVDAAFPRLPYTKYNIGGKDVYMSNSFDGKYVTNEEAEEANRKAQEIIDLETYDERRNKIQENKVNRVEEKYKNLTPEQKNSGAALAGNITKTVTSPTTLLPIGQIKLAAPIGKEIMKFAGVSSLWGAEYSVLQQAAETGDIDATQVLKDSAIAGATGGVFRGTAVPIVSKAYNLIKPTKTSGKNSITTANNTLDEIEYETARLIEANAPKEQIPSIVKTKLKLTDDQFNNVLKTSDKKMSINLDNPNPKIVKDILAKKENVNQISFENGNKFTQFTKEVLQPIHSRLLTVAPKLAARLRTFESNIHKQGSQYINRIKPFIKGIRTGKLNIGGGFFKLTKNERVKVTKSLMNRDYDTAEKILNKYSRSKGTLNEVRKVLDDVFSSLQNAGVKGVKYMENYFPRRVINVKQLRKEINNIDKQEANRLATELRNARLEKNRALTIDEEEAIIRNRLQAVMNAKPNAKLGNMQNRQIEELYDNLLKYYDEPENALLEYIQGAVNVIERKNFFGQSSVADDLLSFNSDKSIAKLINDELGDFSDDALDEIETVLTARFSPQFADKPAGHTVQIAKNLIYASHLGNPYNALTQLGDLGISAYTEGILNIPKGIMRSITNSGIDVRDLGVENFAAELGTQKGWTRALVDLSFKTGFAKIDRFGKNVLINSAFQKVFKQVTATGKKLEKNLAQLRKEYGNTFGDDMDNFINAVRNKDFQDPNVQLYLFNRLADAQPITMSELPAAYLRNPNGRLLYTLKSYSIKQLDIMRKDIWRNVADGIKEKNIKKVGEGVKNAMAYTVLVTGGNTAVKEVKDFTLGKTINMDKLSDDFGNNILQQFFLSKYMVDRTLSKGDIPEALIQTVVPPYDWASYLGKDIFHVLGVDEFFNPLDPFKKLNKELDGGYKYKSLQYLPFLGKLPYWYWMGGKEDYEKKEFKKSMRLE